MADIYLTPDDINASDTRLVLAFLNTVQTADELATRVEIPDELDIGVRLGQRILDARQELGGRFTNLQQLLNVPLIGSERFTEVVTEALQRSALEILSRNQQAADSGQVLALASQLESLKKWANEFEHLNPNRYRIEIKALDKTPYLGEVIPLRVRVWDRVTRQPKANLPLTLETNWGNLRWTKGLQVKQGAVITGRTSVTGEIVCHLYTPTIEQLTEPQQNELSLALAKLTHGSNVPNEARESFQQLVLAYQHPLNTDLRKAIDIHYKSRQDRVAESINLPSSVYRWDYEQALVRVYAHPQDPVEASTVLSMSAYTLEYRDWLSPWYQIYKEGLVTGQALQNDLNQALTYSEDEKGVVGHMVSSLHTFIAGQHGLLGERIGQQASQEILTRFLRDNPQNLSDSTRTSIYTVLTQAPGAITASNKGSVGIANEIALDVGRSTGLQDMLGNINFDQLTADIAGFNSNIAGFNSSYANFVNDYSSFNNNYSTFNTNYATFNNNYSSFNTNYATFNNNYASFNNDYASFASNYASFNSNYADFNSNYANFSNNYTNFDNNYGNWQTDYGNFQDGLSNFNTAKDQLISNVTNGVNQALSTIEANVRGSTGTSVVISPIENVNVGRNINRPGRG
ncbi:MAG: hypothetical protein MI867_28475 [Pseudomonadales bacterium]|nr:hypothetical protein [Pseudomonadales bacterium]